MKTSILTLTLGIFILLSLVSVQALVIESVSVTPDNIVPGETGTIRVGIENDGRDGNSTFASCRCCNEGNP